MTKIRQKVSGTMRTQRGAENFADLRSYLQATAKHGIQTLGTLIQLTSRNPWLPGYPRPVSLQHILVELSSGRFGAGNS